MFEKTSAWIRSWHAVILLLLAMALFVSKSLYNVPITIMALLGLYRMCLYPRILLDNPTIKLYGVLFLCLWLPLLISLTDTVNLTRSLQTAVPYLRFLFMGIFLIQQITDQNKLRVLVLGMVVILTIWCIDVLIQFLFLVDLFGHVYQPGQAMGMFTPRNTLAHIAAALSPLYFEWIRQQYHKHKWTMLLVFPLVMTILLSGRRAAWIMMAISTVGYLYYLFRFALLNRAQAMALAGLVILILATMITITLTHEGLHDRASLTLQLFSNEAEEVDVAGSRRLSLWIPSARMIRDHWINGIGPRGYRFVFDQYSEPDNFWHQTASTHPHQMLLEIMVETGTIGLIGLMLWFCLLFGFLRHSPATPGIFPWVLATTVAMLPINTHMAFYGSYWSSLIWWLTAMMFVVITVQQLPPMAVKDPASTR